jgi:phosphoglycerate dehydrogenase-like enzyme
MGLMQPLPQALPASIKIIVGDSNLTPLRDEFEQGLPAGATVSWHSRFDEDALVADLGDADVYVGARFTSAMGAAAARLRLVHVAGAGFDGIDADALPAGAVCANTFHHEASIAEYVAAMTVVLRRRLMDQDRELRAGHWASSVYEPERKQMRALHGATVGIVGFGHIGARVWQVLRAFGARGLTVSRSPVDTGEHGLDWAGGIDDLEHLLRGSDVVVLSLPLGPSTRAMIAARELAMMKPDAIVVNVSRGLLIDEAALYTALAANAIGGAVLDVWYQYPSTGAQGTPASYPFDELSNVLMTPHISGVTRQTFEGRVADIVANIGHLALSEPIANVVIAR